MKKIRTRYHLTMDFLFREISVYFWIAAGSFLLLTLFTTYLFAQNQELVQSLLKKVMGQFQGIIADGQISFVRLFLNNLEASAMGIVVGFVPFIFLPVVGIVSNAAVMGLVFSSSQLASYPIWKVVLFGVLPHGVFELTAVMLSYAMGLAICWNITKKMIGYRRNEKLKDLLKNCFWATLLVVVPLLVIAALIETYGTAHIMAAFL